MTRADNIKKEPTSGAKKEPTSGVSGHTRGVSDAIAFVLTFSVIILAVTGVSVGGLDGLTDLRDQEQIKSADRGIEAAANQLDRIHRQNAPVAGVSLGLYGGRIRVTDSEITLNSSDFDHDLLDTHTIQAIEHYLQRPNDDSTVTIAYEAGGAFNTGKLDPLYDPTLRCDDDGDGNDLAVVSLVALETPPDDDISLVEASADQPGVTPENLPGEAPVSDGGFALRLLAEQNQSERHYTRFGGENQNGTITVDISGTANPIVWERYFATTGGWTPDENRDQAFSCEADEALIRLTTIRISR
jgi:hypothetical protein